MNDGSPTALPRFTLHPLGQFGDPPPGLSEQGKADVRTMLLRQRTPYLALSDRSKPLPQRSGKPCDQPAGLCLDGSWLLYYHKEEACQLIGRYIARTCKGRFMQQRHVAYDLLRSTESFMSETF